MREVSPLDIELLIGSHVGLDIEVVAPTTQLTADIRGHLYDVIHGLKEDTQHMTVLFDQMPLILLRLVLLLGLHLLAHQQRVSKGHSLKRIRA